MDYPFFIGKIGQCSDDTLLALQSLAENTPYDPHPYFSGNDAPLINGRLAGYDAIPQELTAMLAAVGLTRARYAVSSFNKLSGPRIGEHSDSQNGGALSFQKIHRHIVHVSVTGQAIYQHRRSRRDTNSESTMVLGGVYLYNNYVWHGIDNVGQEPRINMLIEFSDLRWEVKDQLLGLFGMDDNKLRYEAPNAYPERIHGL